MAIRSLGCWPILLVASTAMAGQIDVRTCGARGNGAGDDTDAIQSAIDRAANGDTVLFPAGRYPIMRQIGWSGKRLTLKGQGDAVLVEARRIVGRQKAAAMVLVEGKAASGSVVTGLAASGAENLANFDGGAGTDNAFLRFVGVTDALADGCKVVGKSYGVILDRCVTSTVRNLAFTGFLTEERPGKNFSAAARIDGGSANRIVGLQSKRSGSGIIVGQQATGFTIQDSTIQDARDNGVYISSGSDGTIDHVNVLGAISSGFKIRGSGHLVEDCRSESTGVGFNLTGRGAIADPQGANGAGTRLLRCTVDGARKDGIVVGKWEGLYPRGFVIRQCVVRNVGRSVRSSAGILVLGGTGHTIDGNDVSANGAEFGIAVSSEGMVLSTDDAITGNRVSAAKQGIRAIGVRALRLSGNIVHNSPVGIYLEGVANSTVEGNDGTDGVSTAVVHIAGNGSNNSIRNNKGKR